ncbi:hypothetical protein BpHYR1_045644 [Brachionus plicatilis]|uniref:Uncharacterized protein n=1 Tax=Brachionus plicatilis TaxID=10195 RepID=A0A3M7TAV8_BRAPC|nr:hypothetical protein BpHYR1_045644 [Brachionus plicatilis]
MFFLHYSFLSLLNKKGHFKISINQIHNQFRVTFPLFRIVFTKFGENTSIKSSLYVADMETDNYLFKHMKIKLNSASRDRSFHANGFFRGFTLNDKISSKGVKDCDLGF